MLNIQNLHYHYDAKYSIINDFSLQLKRGELATLLGASGCGKTTLLRIIAGFLAPNQGKIELHSQKISACDLRVLPEHRNIGMVFQDYALFPHLNVEKNIAFGLHAYKENKSHRINTLLELVGLQDLKYKYPHELSGGQQQRIALARALAPSPDLILMDEPFSNLDAELREKLCPQVRDILKDSGTSAIMVTHDQQEAFNFSDIIGIMQAGKLLQWSNPYDLYHKPNSIEVANFIGQSRFISAQVLDQYSFSTPLGVIKQTEILNQPLKTQGVLILRPEHIILQEQADSDSISVQITQKLFKGHQILCTLQKNEIELLGFLPFSHNYKNGKNINIKILASSFRFFPN